MSRRQLLVVVLFITVLIILWFSELLLYGIRQGIGQGRIVWNARPVTEVLADPATPDSIGEKLRFIGKVRQYAIEQLGLNDTENYTTYFDQQGKELMWVVTASPPFGMEEYLWDFPVVGKVPYKGFFREDLAVDEANRLRADSMDVNIRNPGGWSTLGWFRDPILSGMLSRDPGDLASLIIHEMAHATIFIPDQVNFNENLASFIGDEGARLFLTETEGPASPLLLAFEKNDLEYRRWSSHMVRGADVLDSLYRATEAFSDDRKRVLKKEAIGHIVLAMDTLYADSTRRPSLMYSRKLPNNATFMAYRRYFAMQTDFGTAYRGQFGGDIRKMVVYYKLNHPR